MLYTWVGVGANALRHVESPLFRRIDSTPHPLPADAQVEGVSPYTHRMHMGSGVHTYNPEAGLSDSGVHLLPA
jgi:hypothetical protein